MKKKKRKKLTKKDHQKLWDASEETLNPNSRYNYRNECWIIRAGCVVPDGLTDEYRDGRVIVMAQMKASGK